MSRNSRAALLPRSVFIAAVRMINILMILGAGWLLLPFPSGSIQRFVALKRSCLLSGSLGLWVILLHLLIPRFVNDSKADKSGKAFSSLASFLLYVILAILTFVFLTSLHLIREEVGFEFFALLIVAVGFDIIHIRCIKKELFLLSHAASLLFSLTAAYLSIYCSVDSWLWQPLVIAAALAFIPEAASLGAYIENLAAGGSSVTASPKILQRLLNLYGVALILPSVTFGVLAFFGQLPTKYGILFGLTALCSFFVSPFQGKDSPSLPKHFSFDAHALALVYSLVLLGLRLI